MALGRNLDALRYQLKGSCSHTCACVTKQYNLVPAEQHRCSAAGKVTVGLAIRRRFQWFIHLRARSLRKGDGHLAYTPNGA